MAPRAPVPHLTHPKIVHARKAGLLERLLTPFVAPLMVLWAAMTILATRFQLVLRPGVNVLVRLAPAPSGPPTDTGVWFVAGLTERGPVDAPRLVRNIGEFENIFGVRQSDSNLWDCLDVFFRDGGLKAQVQRVNGTTPTKGTSSLKDRSAGAGLNTITITANDYGAFSTGITYTIADGVGTNTFEIFVYYNGVLKERSGDLASPTAAVAWAMNSAWIRVADLASGTVAPNNNPRAVAAVALSAGTDDRATVNDAAKTAALAKILADLGPGQVSYPGATTTTMHTALVAHATACNRTAILDAPDTGDVASMVAAVLSVRGSAEPERAGVFGPNVVVPGLTSNTTRILPPSCVIAGLIARNDLVNGTSIPAAGPRGQSRVAIDVTRRFSDADRVTANDGGANIIRPLFGPITLYGYRTCSAQTQWRSLSDQRLRMEIVNQCSIIGEDFMFAQIDGQGHTIAAFAGSLRAMLAGYYNKGALYGATPAEAFSVNVGDSVNTPDTIAAQELHAVIGLKMSPFAEVIYIEIVKYPVNQTMAA